MSVQLHALQQSIEQLSVTERAELVHHILSHLEEEETGVEAAWQEELQQRVAEFRAGEMACISEDELFARLNRKVQ